MFSVKREWLDLLGFYAGVCDFLLSRSKERLYVKAPVVAIVEAKNENIKAGFGQCIAEMVAAQRFNAQDETGVAIVYGVVTTGSNWRFLRLFEQSVSIDPSEFYFDGQDIILGILLFMVGEG